MALQSQLFRGNPQLEAAAVSDPAHIIPGAKGEHVRKIQLALILLDGAKIAHDGAYGPKTAAAVLAYKQKRNIVNRSYQTQADNIVGKMTMASLDREMLERERVPHPPVRIEPKSYWVMRSRPLALNASAIGKGRRGGPVVPKELKVPLFGAGFFDVVDGWPGKVEVMGPPIIKICTHAGFSPPGDSFLVSENPQRFTLLGREIGTTTIAATLELADFSSQDFIDVEVVGTLRKIAWGAKVSAAFKAKVIKICGNLGVDPNHLMAAMAFESMETFSPSVKNRVSGATGLIQFMPSTATTLGTSTGALAAMTPETQLDYVEKYFKPNTNKLHTLEDVYMAILWPAAIGKPNSEVLFSKPSKEYTQNAGLDAPPPDGKITKDEAAAQVRAKLLQGLAHNRLG